MSKESFNILLKKQSQDFKAYYKKVKKYIRYCLFITTTFLSFISTGHIEPEISALIYHKGCAIASEYPCLQIFVLSSILY